MLYTNSLSRMLDEVFAYQTRILDDAFVYDSVVKQKDGQTKIDVVVPGYAKEDLKLDVSDGILTLSSDLKEKKFSRKWKLTDNVDVKKIKAECKNGILTFCLIS